MDAQGSATAGETDIAIIGMAGRFPGARNLDEFWQNLQAAKECITSASDDALIRAGTAPAFLNDPRYVRARGRLDDVELFDAEFFGFSAREAEVTDPQQRLFLECASEALERAGYGARAPRYRVGVYAGASLSTYLLFHLWPNSDLLSSVGEFEALTANDKDYLSTRVSYKLDLRGPSVTVQTACSTSLVAVHLACQSLLDGECDIALAGGVAIVVPQDRGYMHRPGGIMSPDGHCRAFDAAAAGTVFGNGLGIVVMRRLEDALTDGDSIAAVIKGTAINNDGGLKVGYTAPSLDGQAAVISEALSVAGIHPSTIGYVEAHGTGTLLGDPIEVAALSKVFGSAGVTPGSCALGSVKTSVGHLDTAAGVAGLIKTVLALQHGSIPATLNFHTPNPEIDFASCPFYVNTSLREWPSNGIARRAGVSSFGIGGTNAHVLLEAAPPRPAAGPSRPWQLLTVSARSASALERAALNLRRDLEGFSDDDLPDVAYTLQVGRKRFSHRRMLVVGDRSEAIETLSDRGASRVEEREDRPVVFMFPGQGAQHPGMAEELYASEPVFREHLDRCAELLRPLIAHDIRDVLYLRSRPETADLRQTEFAQPALFAVEYSLAHLWMAWGVRPRALIGHSLGEYVAASVAGVFSLEDALSLVVHRAQLMQSTPPGAMLAVLCPERDVSGILPAALSLAAINGPSLCVASGPYEEIGQFERELGTRHIESHRLHTSHAFHSSMMDSVVEPLTRLVERTSRRPPAIPFVSNVTGMWISDADAQDPAYWGRHLRQPVRFADGLSTLLGARSHFSDTLQAQSDVLLVEVGPGSTLAAIANGRRAHSGSPTVFPSLGHPLSENPDQRVLLGSLGGLWLAGARIDWERFSAHERRIRVPLSTYPFERQRYWIEPPSSPMPQPIHQASAFETDLVTPVQRPVGSSHSRPRLRTTYVAPATDLETIVAGVWEDLLGTAPIGVDDNFFELGGNSLIATRVASHLRDTFPLDLPLRTLFEATTIAELARLLESLLLERVEEMSETDAGRLLARIDLPAEFGVTPRTRPDSTVESIQVPGLTPNSADTGTLSGE